MKPYSPTFLKAAVLERLEKTSLLAREPRELTIGVEHEFFLLDRQRLPATHDSSQSFFKKLAETPGWRTKEKIATAMGETVWRVSVDEDGARYTAFKYDHHPHLCEIAFSYFQTIEELHTRVSEVFGQLEAIADKTGLVIAHQPFAGLETDDPRIVSNIAFFRNLRSYRTRLFEHRNEAPDARLINYAAGIAATQIHIGNTLWWRDTGYVEELYKREPQLLPYGFILQETADEQSIQDRWKGYSKVFSGYPLVGFPRLESWTTDSWIGALLRSPLYADANQDWAGKTLLDLKENPFCDYQEFLKSVRDLQIIRPRLFGTLEFRADPAQPSISAICALAALRLGLCVAAKNQRSRIEFSRAREQWWKIAAGAACRAHPDLLKAATIGLHSRPFGEARFLEPYRNALAQVLKSAGDLKSDRIENNNG